MRHQVGFTSGAFSVVLLCLSGAAVLALGGRSASGDDKKAGFHFIPHLQVGQKGWGTGLLKVGGFNFSLNGEFLAVVGVERLWVIEVRTGRVVQVHNARDFSAGGDAIFLSNEHIGFLGGVLGSPPGAHLKVWNWKRHRTERTLVSHPLSTRRITLSHDRQFVLGTLESGELCVWDWGDGTLVKRVPVEDRDEYPYDVRVSPDGKWLATSTAKRTTIRRWPTCEKVHEIPNFGACLEFSRDSRMLSINDIGEHRETMGVWDVRQGTLIHRHRLPQRNIFLAKFHPAENRLIILSSAMDSADHRQPITIHSPTTGRVNGKVEGNQVPGNGFGNVALSPDGRYLAAISSRDGTVCVWEAAQGKETKRTD